MHSKKHEKIRAAIVRLAAEMPPSYISLSAVARESGVSWPTVRRHVLAAGGVEAFLPDAASGSVQAPPAEVHDPDRTRERVLEAAFHVFAQKGIHGATLDDVAAAAGMTKGAVYWHFVNKDALVLALVEQRMKRESLRVPEDLAEALAGGEGAVALAELLRRQVADTEKNIRWWWLDNECMSRSLSEELRKRHAEFGERFFRDTVTMAEGLAGQGLIDRTVNPEGLAFLIRLIVLGLGRWMSQETTSVDFSERMHDVAKILWNGIEPSDEPVGKVAG